MAWLKPDSELFSPVDTAWLHMDTPTNMAMITGVYVFDKPLDIRRLIATVQSRLLKYKRFRQRVVQARIGLPRWENDPYFNIHNHIHHIALPSPGDHAALEMLVGDLMGMPLDFSKPLWHFHVVENYHDGMALVVRLHHCIADGLALMQVMLSITDQEPDAPWPEAEEQERKSWNPLKAMVKPVTNVARKTLHAAEFVWNEGAATVAKPERMLEAAQFTADSAKALNKLLFTGTDEKTLFKGKCGVPKRAAWTKPLPLEEIKAIGQQIGATINDVILTAMTGALRRYLEKRTQEVDGFNIRAVVPVSIRPPQDFNKLGNRFGLVFLSLPIGVQDPLKRVLVLKRRMDMIKGTPEALVAFGILTAIGLTPQQIEHIIINIFAMKATAVMTNVPGPRQQLFFAGSAIRNLIFWVPTPGQLGLGVSILSYNGGVTLGVMTDEGLVPDPEKIIEGFYAEIELMRSWIVDTPEL